MVQQVRKSRCLDPDLVDLYGEADDLPPINGQRRIVVCEGIPIDKKERHSFGREEVHRSDCGTFSGNRLDVYSDDAATRSTGVVQGLKLCPRDQMCPNKGDLQPQKQEQNKLTSLEQAFAVRL